jgi:trehalose/maltose hydrolase-like predicted phosphorylase
MSAHCSAEWLASPFDSHEDAWVLSTDQPHTVDHRYAPIANGLLGIRVNPDGDASGYRFGSVSYMHGVWERSTQPPFRREAIMDLPHWATLRFAEGRLDPPRDFVATTEHRQELDLRNGVVRTRRVVESVTGHLTIERETWLSRADKHVAVLAATLSADQPVTVLVDEYLDALHLPHLGDVESREEDGDLWLSCTSTGLGHRLGIASRLLVTGSREKQLFQQTVSCRGPVVRRAFRLFIEPGQIVLVTKVVAVVSDVQSDEPLAEARRQVAGAAGDLTGLRQRHEAAWAALWESRIETDHPRLQQVLNASLFYLYSTVREDEPHSHGPCGLSSKGWDGTVFWDTDLWTLPVFALFQPALARACATYRQRTLEGAKQNAREHGEQGARYAWQSAQTGLECCLRPVFQEERHIVSCVARGQWLTAVATGDEAWLLGPARQVVEACADYWLSRAVHDPVDNHWHIRQVCGPDEDAGLVDDNATTNWGAVWTLRLATQLARRAGREPNPQWSVVADGLVIPWDDERNIPKQMAGWRHGQTIKQADATLLAHPWNYPMDDATKARMVDYYRAHYPANQIMMGVAIDGIVDCQVNRPDAAWKCFEHLLPHLRRPYLIATESPNNEASNFLTGLGGLLQLVCMGFAGVIADEEQTLRARPCLPSAINQLRLIGVHHQGRCHEVTVTRDSNQSRASIRPLPGEGAP